MTKRHIVYVTGTRADYGLMKEVLYAIEAHPNLDLSILITGMHLLNEFGATEDLIVQDGFKISARVSMTLGEDSSAAMAKSVGIALLGMVQAFESDKPDVILLEGDRGESLAAAIGAAHMQIAVAHMSGGDVTGGAIDEPIRHAITKFAHIHFPGTNLSAERIKSMGEDPAHIHMVGTPGCDIRNELSIEPDEVAKQLDLDLEQPIVLVLQHPVTTEPEAAPDQMRETMEAVRNLGLQSIVVYPNSDAGGRQMISVIQEYQDLPFIKIHQNLSRELFVGLLNITSVMVGNSSSALVEAPSLGVPAVDIGARQASRERGNNIFEVPHDSIAIEKIIRSIIARLNDKEFKAQCLMSPYRDMDTPNRVAEILGNVEINGSLFQKAFCDRSAL
jgi:GDP/UDP-N,N'-diacetylbacillosamine 2-epimerase (hydrolysing)